MNKPLNSLIKSYESSIKGVEDIVKKTKEEIAQAQRMNNSDSVRILARKLAVCYEEIRDMRIVMNTLKDSNTYNDFEYEYKEAAV